MIVYIYDYMIIYIYIYIISIYITNKGINNQLQTR